MNKLIKWTIILGLPVVIGAEAAFYVAGDTVEAAIPQTIVVEAPAPILDRIADCESGNKGEAGSASQTKDGQVLIHINNNGTYDIGKFQINSIHNAEATKLGFNLATEEGNSGYAKYLYQNRGTQDWSSSAHCWQR